MNDVPVRRLADRGKTRATTCVRGVPWASTRIYTKMEYRLHTSTVRYNANNFRLITLYCRKIKTVVAKKNGCTTTRRKPSSTFVHIYFCFNAIAAMFFGMGIVFKFNWSSKTTLFCILRQASLHITAFLSSRAQFSSWRKFSKPPFEFRIYHTCDRFPYLLVIISICKFRCGLTKLQKQWKRGNFRIK